MARCFESISLTSFLSFGPEPTVLELGDVNVLVGPNGAGKSNLLEAFDLLRHAPHDIGRPLREGGGVREYLWQPSAKVSRGPAPTAIIDVQLAAGLIAEPSTRYRIAFSSEGGRLSIIDERIEDALPRPGHDEAFLYFGHEDGRPVMSVALRRGGWGSRRSQDGVP